MSGDAENEKARRARLRAAVEMPDQEAEELPHVEGTREYRRNALVMMLGGLFLSLGSLVVAAVSGRFFWVIFLVGLGLCGMGGLRFLTGGKDG